MSHSQPAPNSFCDGTGKALRLLYADDVPELRNLLQMLFQRDGHEIECYPDGQSALTRMVQNPALDLVITDHHMPRMDGLEFVERLRELPFFGKIMIFSSELSPAIMEKYQRLGVDRILYKPVYPSVLRQVLSEMFGIPARPSSPASAHPFPRPTPALSSPSLIMQ